MYCLSFILLLNLFTPKNTFNSEVVDSGKALHTAGLVSFNNPLIKIKFNFKS